MSLMRLAWRVCAVEALMGKTSIPDVCDSAINAFSLDGGKLKTEKEKPFISVYTGNGKIEGSAIDGRSMNQNGLTELTIETGVATAMAVTNDEGVGYILNAPITDPSLEMLLDIAGFEITAALTDPKNEWGQLFIGMIDDLIKVERNGARNAEDGARVAGHQIIVCANLLQDPVRGCPIEEDSVLGKFLELAGASETPHVKRVSEKISGALEGELNTFDSYYQSEFGLGGKETKDVLGDTHGLEQTINHVTGPHAGIHPESISVTATPEPTDEEQ